MSPRSKREYLAAIVGRYRRASRKVETTILDEFCSTCNYHRKHALRLFHNFFCPSVKLPQDPRCLEDREALG